MGLGGRMRIGADMGGGAGAREEAEDVAMGAGGIRMDGGCWH